MKKMNILFLSFFIMSCASQSAPPLNLQDSEDANNRDESNRAELPETPEVTFASEEVENSDIPDSGPAAPDVKKEIVEDIKDELKKFKSKKGKDLKLIWFQAASIGEFKKSLLNL